MHIIIMGMSVFGFNLASLLVKEGQDVVLIENNMNKCNNIADKIDANIIYGNGTDTEVLEESDIRSAHLFVAATSNDDSNLLASILAKGFGVSKIISQVNDPNHNQAFKDAGIETIINPELTAANYITKLIIKPKITDLILLGDGETEIIDVIIEKGKYVNKKIGEVTPDDNFNIIAVYQNGNLIMPRPEMILKPGMRISLIVKTECTKEILECFTEDIEFNIFPGIMVDLYQELQNRKIIK
jgi:trk system potassium uptake protein TrkA